MYEFTRIASRARHRWYVLAVIAVCGAVGLACASRPLPRLPALVDEPTQLVKPGKFVWTDLVSQDPEASKTFYGALFGWTFEDGDGYTPVLLDGARIAGIVKARDPERGSEWVVNLSVADVDRATALVKERGGLIERQPTDAPDRGRLSLVSDPQGALVLLLRATDGDPPDADPVLGGWLWRELWARDVDAAVDLYTTLAGYEPATVDFRGGPYQVLETDGTARAGITQAPPEVYPLWLPYVRVEDAGKAAARAEELGARIVTQDDRTAILVDPTGAPIGVGTWKRRESRDAGSAQ